MIRSNSSWAREDEVWTLELNQTIETSLSHSVWVAETMYAVAGGRPEKLVIDLAEAGHIDTRGLRHLLTLNDLLEQEHIQLVLRDPCFQLHRILQIMQLHHIFTIEFSEDRRRPARRVMRRPAASQTRAGSHNRC